MSVNSCAFRISAAGKLIQAGGTALEISNESTRPLGAMH